jgi:hypothetical protein
MSAITAGDARAYRPEITVGPAISTLGLGGDVGIRFNDFIGVRVAGNAWVADFDAGYGDIDYNVDFTLASVGPMLDVYPFGGVFRITGGFRYNMNGVGLTATPNTNITIGGTTYTPGQVGTLDGDIDLNTLAPYVGLGLEFTLLNGMMALGAEAGVLFQGEPSVSLSSSTGVVSQADLDAEAQQIEDDLSILAYYPVITLYMTLRF